MCIRDRVCSTTMGISGVICLVFSSLACCPSQRTCVVMFRPRDFNPSRESEARAESIAGGGWDRPVIGHRSMGVVTEDQMDLRTAWAALKPFDPCTPPPGGVAAEQMKTLGIPVS